MRWCNTDAYGDGFANGDADTDANAYSDGHVYGDGYGDCHSNAHTDANGYRDCFGYLHADAYSDANRDETIANAAAASNNTAAETIVRSGKWNSSCGNSRVTLASSLPEVDWLLLIFALSVEAAVPAATRCRGSRAGCKRFRFLQATRLPLQWALQANTPAATVGLKLIRDLRL